MMYLHHLEPNKRVATAPHTDAWMSGERYGTVLTVGRKYVTIKGERSGRKFRFVIDNPDGFDMRVPGLGVLR